MFIDSHCHFDGILEEGKFSESQLFDQLREQRVNTAVQIGTDIESSLWSKDFAADKDNIYYTAGLHPEYRFETSLTEELLRTIASCAADKKCIAVGEIGLDYHYEGFDRESQRGLLELQLDAAKKAGLPVVIHSRDSMDDTLAILDNAGLSQVLFHCFGGSRDDARRVIERGWYISFAGNLTFKKAVDLQQAAEYTPSDRILFETDAPYLAPVPVRGTLNVPANVRHTYAFAAQLRKAAIEELAGCAARNFATLFERTKL